MPRQSRKDQAKKTGQDIERRPQPRSQKPAVLHGELCVTCPLCGLQASIIKILPDKSREPRFTGQPYEIRLYINKFGGRRPAPRGTPKGKKQKKAKGIQEWVEVTENHATELQEVQRVILESGEKIVKELGPYFITGGG